MVVARHRRKSSRYAMAGGDLFVGTMRPLLTESRLHRIEDVNKHCLAEFRKHWTCLDGNNQQLWQCRAPEWKLNKCVFDNLVREFFEGSWIYANIRCRRLRKLSQILLLARHQFIFGRGRYIHTATMARKKSRRLIIRHE